MDRLIYIVGSGRSGSTVMERVLNSSDRLVGVGEIHALWRLPIDGLMCSCGATVPDCTFWQSALSHAEIDADDLAELAELEDSVIRNKFLVRKRYDLRKIARDPGIVRFNALQARLFDGVRVASGAEIVLDSSKAGPRAWALAASERPPVFLHAYRNARDVIASWRKPKFEPSTNSLMNKPSLGNAALDWIKVEQAARSLARRGQKVSRVNYLDFAKAPRPTLHAALEPWFSGLVDTMNWRGERDVAPGAQYHSVLGNPDRFDRGVIQIRPQRVAAQTFSRSEAIAIQSVAAVLQRIYR
ncbi:hypothetical protein [Shimia sp.]|uniref:hypothetical protein n=1 Tax=Shimia sp. TaxID=1954381 RepID=UPI003BAA8437